MKFFSLPIALFLFFFITACGSGVSLEEDRKAVKNTFSNYTKAVKLNQKEEIIKQVDSRTIAYYQTLLTNAVSADSTQLSALPLLDKFTVLTIRCLADEEQLNAMDATGLFTFMLENGAGGTQSVEGITIGEVSIEKDFAKALLIFQGDTLNVYSHFYREEGKWKMDLTQIFKIGADAFGKTVASSGVEEDVFIYGFLLKIFGERAVPEIWNGPIAKKIG